VTDCTVFSAVRNSGETAPRQAWRTAPGYSGLGPDSLICSSWFFAVLAHMRLPSVHSEAGPSSRGPERFARKAGPAEPNDQSEGKRAFKKTVFTKRFRPLAPRPNRRRHRFHSHRRKEIQNGHGRARLPQIGLPGNPRAKSFGPPRYCCGPFESPRAFPARLRRSSAASPPSVPTPKAAHNEHDRHSLIVCDKQRFIATPPGPRYVKALAAFPTSGTG